MPCDSIETTKVEFLAKSTDIKLLVAALRAQGYQVSEFNSMVTFYRYGRRGQYNGATGELTLPESVDGNEIKRGYAEQVAEHVANENGWELQWTVNEDGDREATVEKRIY